MPDLYDDPSLYDIAFSPGTDAQMRHLEALLGRCEPQPARVLDVACGTGRTLIALASRGRRVSGYDASDAMVVFTAERIARLGLAELADVRRADMRHATHPCEFSAAVNLFNSLSHLHHDRDIVRHLRLTAAALRPDGVYIVQLEHAWNDIGAAATGTWSAARGGLSVDVAWRILAEDAERRTSTQLCQMMVHDARGSRTLERGLTLRLWLHGDLARLAAAAELTFEASFTEDLALVPPGRRLTGELGNLYCVLRRAR